MSVWLYLPAFGVSVSVPVSKQEEVKKHMCAQSVRMYVECVCPRFFKYVAFRNFVPVKELFVGSEYASVSERMRSSVMFVYVTGFGRKSIY